MNFVRPFLEKWKQYSINTGNLSLLDLYLKIINYVNKENSTL